MLDIRLLRQTPNNIQERLRTKDPQIDIAPVVALDQRLRELKTQSESLLAERNSLSKQIGELKRTGQDCTAIMEQVESIKSTLAGLESELQSVQAQFQDQFSRLPNLPQEDSPISLDPKENRCIKEVGNKPHFDFAFKNHVELNEELHLFDFKRAAKITGSGWPIYRGWGARLEWALIQYMIEIHIKNGFEQFIPPLLVRQQMMYGSGQLPKFEEQLFKLNDPEFPLYLIPTAEVALNALYYDEILDESLLPAKYIAYTPCFRREAGAAGSQERGLIRMHQFNKVEMFVFSTPEQSAQMFDEMMKSAEEILQGLELHYRNMLLVTGDMSYAAAKTVDIEVWLPGQNRYYEVSSVSNCTDFQARRSQTRFKRNKEGALEFVHTLNGSGLATSRLMVAILENNQQADGSVIIPKVLQKYLGGQERLTVTRRSQ